MTHPQRRRAIIAATLFLLGVNDMSNHAISFESTRIGVAPEGWTATLTGSGDPKWTVESDETAPSKSKVVKQSGRATYPLLQKNDTSIKDCRGKVQGHRGIPGPRRRHCLAGERREQLLCDPGQCT